MAPATVIDLAGKAALAAKLREYPDPLTEQGADGFRARACSRAAEVVVGLDRPALHTRRGGWDLTALFSNSQRAHELGRTRDRVTLYWHADGLAGDQWTVVTEARGPLAGHRVVRGRERECEELYGRQALVGGGAQAGRRDDTARPAGASGKGRGCALDGDRS